MTTSLIPGDFFEVNNVIDRVLSDWDNFFSLRDPFSGLACPKYPVTNHYVKKDGTNVLEIGVPGWSKKDITVNIDGDVLTIEGKKEAEKKDEEEEVYITRKLAKRNFKISYKLSDRLLTTDTKVKMENGILALSIPVKPEEKKEVKQIEIK